MYFNQRCDSIIYFIFSIILLHNIVIASSFYEREQWNPKLNICPRMLSRVFVGYAPRGNLTAGNFTEMPMQTTLKSCTLSCCQKPNCNIIFMHVKTCYHVECASNDLCLPILRSEKKMGNRVKVVLVRPVGEGESWSDLLDESEDTVDRDVLDHFISDDSLNDYREPMEDSYLSDENMMTAETNYPYTLDCNHENDCREHEECAKPISKELSGICKCVQGFVRNATGFCQLKNVISTTTKQDISTKIVKKQITVSVMSKEVRLPESEATLSAFTIPSEPPNGQHYTYEWTLLKKPANADTGTKSDQEGPTLHLSHLTEGSYVFKVTVSTSDSYGEAFANVSVLPPKRINQQPVVIITPSTQIVRLPNTGAVLDGSSSHDDDAIISWHWELQRGPLDYSPHLPDTPMLQLNDLSIPGNYTFRLTVTDSDHVTNSTSANITVLKVIDYQPVANAGQDVIVYLPLNEVTLNGNLSTDDHEITSWEWTKSPGDADKAADMQDTRTPYLKLSHLEEGVYTFSLRVTDSANQSSTAEVRVFVKPATHKPPVAHAGGNLTISLPQTWTLLEGSSVSESGRVVSYLWEQVSGPANAVFLNANMSKTNITHLTKGQYVLKLTVKDDSGNIASDTVVLNVTQNKNERPKANAGGDQTVELPKTVIQLNGSSSHDDLAIVSWQWTREDMSLAIGNILGNSSHEPVLLLSNLEPGRYVFKLRVTDEDGLFDEDTASLMVKPNPMLKNLVELTLGAQASSLTERQVHEVMQELGLLVRDEAILNIQEIGIEHPGGRAVLSLSAKDHQNLLPLPAPRVERLLKTKLHRDSSLLRLSVASLRTAVCQNNCSNHGVCDERTRMCLCEAFWMQNLFTKYIGNGEADCEWSVLYVVIALCSAGLGITGTAWGCVWLCQRTCYQRRLRSTQQRPPKYALLGDGEQPSYFAGPKLAISESDTDSDVLFESRNKNGQRELIRNGHTKLSHNGFKFGRRVKT